MLPTRETLSGVMQPIKLPTSTMLAVVQADCRWPLSSGLSIYCCSRFYSYGRECLIDPNKYHYLVCGCIEFDCGHMDIRMDVQTYVRKDGHFYRVY